MIFDALNAINRLNDTFFTQKPSRMLFPRRTRCARRHAAQGGFLIQEITRFCAEIRDDESIADMMGLSVTCVRNIRKRYVNRDNLARLRAEQISKTNCKRPVNRSGAKAKQSQKTQ